MSFFHAILLISAYFSLFLYVIYALILDLYSIIPELSVLLFTSVKAIFLKADAEAPPTQPQPRRRSRHDHVCGAQGVTLMEG